MPRWIVTPRDLEEVAGAQAVPGQVKPDDYTARLLKYIPAEVIAAYLAAQGIIESAGSDTGRQTALWIAAALGLVLTPLYLRRAGVRKVRQLTLSSVSFVVWVFALGGPFEGLEFYVPYHGSLALIAVSLIAPLVDPDDPDQRGSDG